ncbi:MAG: dipeptide epimerase [Dysgonamonadaceae bacterium]|jgi:L-alanine-DL-glutamate epimerase-like enolase superfamily enzyme|nr:dipeptide epimerase [Dysgonamonadaceae bacterium]
MNPSALRISHVEIYKCPILLEEPFIISLGTFTHAWNVVVRIHTCEGITGTGECSPFVSINGESMDTCFIVGQYLAQALKGQNPLDIATCTRIMNRSIYANASIKSAFDMALYDIAALHAGQPLYRILGGKRGKKMQIDNTVSLDSPQKMVQDAKKMARDGFEIIKVKLGDSKEADVERIRCIREALGAEIALRIDANQGWKPDEALGILQALYPYDIAYCEEPIPRWAFMALPDIRRNSPIPIMADESCCDHHDAERLLQLNACDMLNIKLGKSGGIYDALMIIEIAVKRGVPVQIGGFLESRLGFTAAAHLALVSDIVQFYDFDSPLTFMEDPVLGGITYGPHGEINLPETPGLGAEIEPGYLGKLEKVVV